LLSLHRAKGGRMRKLCPPPCSTVWSNGHYHIYHNSSPFPLTPNKLKKTQNSQLCLDMLEPSVWKKQHNRNKRNQKKKTKKKGNKNEKNKKGQGNKGDLVSESLFWLVVELQHPIRAAAAHGFFFWIKYSTKIVDSCAFTHIFSFLAFLFDDSQEGGVMIELQAFFLNGRFWKKERKKTKKEGEKMNDFRARPDACCWRGGDSFPFLILLLPSHHTEENRSRSEFSQATRSAADKWVFFACDIVVIWCVQVCLFLRPQHSHTFSSIALLFLFLFFLLFLFFIFLFIFFLFIFFLFIFFLCCFCQRGLVSLAHLDQRSVACCIQASFYTTYRITPSTLCFMLKARFCRFLEYSEVYAASHASIELAQVRFRHNTYHIHSCAWANYVC